MNNKLSKVTFPVNAIGYVKNRIRVPVKLDKLQAIESRIVLDQTLIKGLRGLEVGQQLMIIFYFHRSKGFELLQYPRGDKRRKKRGVFALHSPHRPNPIGVTVVSLSEIDGNTLWVRGLDAINDTPVLDIKPV